MPDYKGNVAIAVATLHGHAERLRHMNGQVG